MQVVSWIRPDKTRSAVDEGRVQIAGFHIVGQKMGVLERRVGNGHILADTLHGELGSVTLGNFPQIIPKRGHRTGGVVRPDNMRRKVLKPHGAEALDKRSAPGPGLFRLICRQGKAQRGRHGLGQVGFLGGGKFRGGCTPEKGQNGDKRNGGDTIHTKAPFRHEGKNILGFLYIPLIHLLESSQPRRDVKTVVPYGQIDPCL